MQSWFDGRILTQESKKYIGNFLSVHRVRPMDDDESDANSDDIVSDEELQMSAASLKEALSTRIGGKDTANKNADVDDAGNAMSHYKNSESAMKLADTVWGHDDSASAAKAKQPSFTLPATPNNDFIISRQRKIPWLLGYDSLVKINAKSLGYPVTIPW